MERFKLSWKHWDWNSQKAKNSRRLNGKKIKKFTLMLKIEKMCSKRRSWIDGEKKNRVGFYNLSRNFTFLIQLTSSPCVRKIANFPTDETQSRGKTTRATHCGVFFVETKYCSLRGLSRATRDQKEKVGKNKFRYSENENFVLKIEVKIQQRHWTGAEILLSTL